MSDQTMGEYEESQADVPEASDWEKGYGPGGLPKKEARKGEWLTKDGRLIRIKEMEGGHLLNTIKMLIRKGAFAREANALQYCIWADRHDGGDGAQMALEQEAEHATNVSTIDYLCGENPKFAELFNEWLLRSPSKGEQDRLVEYEQDWQRRALGYVFNKLRK